MLELFVVQLYPAFCLTVADYPVQKLEGLVVVSGVAEVPKPVDVYWHCGQCNSGGDGEPKVAGVSKEGASNC